MDKQSVVTARGNLSQASQEFHTITVSADSMAWLQMAKTWF